MCALIIEDGTIVTGADSYAEVQDARDYATSRGLTLTGSDAVVEALLRKASDFIDSLESRFQGSRVEVDQPLAWPRSSVFLFNATEEFDTTLIPSLVIKAQCQLAYDASQIDLQPTGTGQEVIREKIDVIEKQYAQRNSGSVSPELNKALAILEPLFGNQGYILSTVRV